MSAAPAQAFAAQPTPTVPTAQPDLFGFGDFQTAQQAPSAHNGAANGGNSTTYNGNGMPSHGMTPMANGGPMPAAAPTASLLSADTLAQLYNQAPQVAQPAAQTMQSNGYSPAKTGTNRAPNYNVNLQAMMGGGAPRQRTGSYGAPQYGGQFNGGQFNHHQTPQYGGQFANQAPTMGMMGGNMAAAPGGMMPSGPNYNVSLNPSMNHPMYQQPQQYQQQQQQQQFGGFVGGSQAPMGGFSRNGRGL